MFSKNAIYLLILFSTIIRIAVASFLCLGNDEVYYLSYAQHLQWNYFDHPPMVALLIRLTSFDLNFTSEFFVRFGSIVLAASNTFLVYKIASQIKNERAGIIAALLFTSSLYSSIITGIFILPDTPMLFFWILSIYSVLQVVVIDQDKKVCNRFLLIFGILVGLSIMSKVHAVFLWLGFGAYIVFFERRFFSNPYLYVAILLTIFIASPILIWNINNDFITYKFHSNRVTVRDGVNLSSFIREIFGGAFYNNPINFFLIGIGVFAFFKKKITIDLPFQRVLIFAGLPLIVVLLGVSFLRDTLPHWSGPGYVSLIILVSCYFADCKEGSSVLKSVLLANFLTLVICVLGVILINYFPGTVGDKAGSRLGRGDVTLDMYDWRYFKNEFDKIHKMDNNKQAKFSDFVLNNKWFPGAHIDNYIAQPLHLNFVGLGSLEDVHTYFWLNKTRKVIKKGDNAYFLTVSNSYSNPTEVYGQSFEYINDPIIIVQSRGGLPARKMYVYKLEGYKGFFPQ